MTDLEITKLCAEAMGYKLDDAPKHHIRAYIGMSVVDYWPLTDDAQAMALVKKFNLSVDWLEDGSGHWMVHNAVPNDRGPEYSTDLNRAIVECVAKMEAARGAQVYLSGHPVTHDHLTTVCPAMGVARPHYTGHQCNNCGRFDDDPLWNDPCPFNRDKKWNANEEQYKSAQRTHGR